MKMNKTVRRYSKIVMLMACLYLLGKNIEGAWAIVLLIITATNLIFFGIDLADDLKSKKAD